MTRKKKSEVIVDKKGFSWNVDDFELDSHGVEAPEKDIFELLAALGRKPEEINEAIRARYVKYLEKTKKAE